MEDERSEGLYRTTFVGWVYRPVTNRRVSRLACVENPGGQVAQRVLLLRERFGLPLGVCSRRTMQKLVFWGLKCVLRMREKRIGMSFLDKNKHAKVTIHRCSSAMLAGNKKPTQRDRHVHKTPIDGVYEWRRESGHYKQSKVENYRHKITIERRLRARTGERGEVEATTCKILKQCIELGRAEPE